MEIVQTKIASAEIAHRQRDARRPELIEEAPAAVGGAHEKAFCDLKLKAAKIQAS